jgi:UDP-N-acetylglucosamine 2-epimerase (non-hydrolysing)
MAGSEQTPRRILTILGTRPEAVKLAPVILELRRRSEFETLVAVTAQHRQMLDQVLSLFEIVPDYDLNLLRPGQSVFDITSRAIAGLEGVLRAAAPELVVVQGDTTTVMTGALAAFYLKIPVGHVEAGLRTFDKYQPFPEELNRRITSVIADLHFAPTERARNNLLAENIRADTVFVTGNTAIDALLHVASMAPAPAHPLLDQLDPTKRLLLVTTHRRENWGEPIRNVCRALRTLLASFADIEIVYALHMNPMVQTLARRELQGTDRIHLSDAIDYGPWVQFLKRATVILTDSGGIQEEAPSLRKPVLVLRNVTERPEGIDSGSLKLVGTDSAVIVSETARLLTDGAEYRRMTDSANPYGDGHASERIADIIHEQLSRA